MFDRHSRDEDLATQIGHVVRRTREEAGWTQRELAARLDSSQSAVQRLESGDSTYIDVRLATAAFRLLGIRSGVRTEGPLGWRPAASSGMSSMPAASRI